jgi:hypothetical protein
MRSPPCLKKIMVHKKRAIKQIVSDSLKTKKDSWFGCCLNLSGGATPAYGLLIINLSD